MAHHLPRMHERFLRHIWSRQYLDQSALCTTDGRTVRVLAVGRINEGSGPDFLGAKIRIGATTYVGDVEVHRDAAEWITHHHQEDPRYNQVILHVVLEARANPPPTISRSGRTIPTLVLESFLNESPQTIWRKAVLDERAYRQRSIPCRDRNDHCDAATLQRLLERMSSERLELKVRRFEERIRQLAAEHLFLFREPWTSYFRRAKLGHPHEIPPPVPELKTRDLQGRNLWDQVLYEGVMEALGYSRNRDPFLRLARSVTLEHAALALRVEGVEGLEAVLFGASGLFPRIPLQGDKRTRGAVRGRVRIWHRQRKLLRIEQMHPSDWVFSPTRPSNFPTVRMAAGARLIVRILREDLLRSTVRVLANPALAAQKQKELRQLLAVPADRFWMPERCRVDAEPALLGTARIDDLIVNVVLPMGLLYARIFQIEEVETGVLLMERSYPRVSPNGITHVMEKQLLKGRLPCARMWAQQGVLQLYTYYCMEGRCRECDVGRVLLIGEEHPGDAPTVPAVSGGS